MINYCRFGGYMTLRDLFAQLGVPRELGLIIVIVLVIILVFAYNKVQKIRKAMRSEVSVQNKEPAVMANAVTSLQADSNAISAAISAAIFEYRKNTK